MRLTKKNNEVDWVSLEPHEYAIFGSYKGLAECGIAFKCPGCGEPLAISILGTEESTWNIDFKTLTATPSILHKRNGLGCGWHGYLTNGELKGKIE